MSSPDRTDTDLTRLDAAELARRDAGPRGQLGRGHPGAPRPDRGGRGHRSARVPARRRRAARLPRPPPSTTRSPRGTVRGPLAGRPARAQGRTLPTSACRPPAASRILDGWRPPYDATAVTQAARGGPGDRWARPTSTSSRWARSTENSAFGPTHNPWDLDRDPRRLRWRVGGGGRGVRGAAGDRHRHRRLDPPAGRASPAPSGSSRPTAASRATAWSRSPPRSTRSGRSARTVLDAALLHEVIAGHDPRDSTSIDAPVPRVVEAAAGRGPRRPRRHAGRRRPRARPATGFQPGVLARFTEPCELLTDLGAEVVEVSCPHFTYALPAYYLIAPSEASSNLARFDAMRYGLRVGDDGAQSTERGHGAHPRGRLRPRGQAPDHPRHLRAVGAATTTPTTARRRRSAR